MRIYDSLREAILLIDDTDSKTVQFDARGSTWFAQLQGMASCASTGIQGEQPSLRPHSRHHGASGTHVPCVCVF